MPKSSLSEKKVKEQDNEMYSLFHIFIMQLNIFAYDLSEFFFNSL